MEEIDHYIQTNHLCQAHKKARISFASLLLDRANPFLCSTCSLLLSQKQEKDILISLEDVLFTDLNQPILNWPLGIDTDSYQFLKNKQTDILKEKMQKDIMNFYDKLTSEINQILFDSQKKQLLELERIQIGSNGLIDHYNNCFQRKELRDIFTNKLIFSKDYYLSFIKTISKTAKNDLEKLSKQIQERRQNEQAFRQFQQKELKDILNTIISQVNKFALMVFPGEGDGEEKEAEEEEEGDYNLFEKYSFSEFSTLIEQDNLIAELITNHICEMNTHPLFYSDQLIIYHERDFVIKISNHQKIHQKVQPFQEYDIADKVSFNLRFNSILSLKNFSFVIQSELLSQNHEFTNLFQKLCNHFEQSKAQRITFKINIDLIQDLLELTTADGFNQNQMININSIEDKFMIQFYLEEGCEGFKITEYECV